MTIVSTSSVQSHIVSVLKDFVLLPDAVPGQLEPIDIQLIRIRNQQIFMETAQTMVNTQQRFCVASSDSFSTLKYCFMCFAPVGFPHDRVCAAASMSNALQHNQT